MRKISLWAKHNRFPAIVFLIAGKLLLVLMAFFIGSSLQEMGIHIPAFIYITAIAMLLLAVLFYPRKKSGVIFKTIFYARQKSCDFAIGLCAFIITAVLVNTDFSIAYPVMSSASNTATVNPPAAADILASLQYRDKSSLTKKEKRVLKQEFKDQLKLYAKAKITGKKQEADRSLLIILTIIGALGLLYLVAALACSLSCSGAEVAAAIVGVIGVVAVVLGVIFIIKAINKRPGRRTEYLPKTDSHI